MVTRDLDSLIARGNTSDVYRRGTDSVVKVLRPGIPDDWAAREAKTTQLVHAAGLPAPEVLDLVTINDRPGIVFRWVEGVSMWAEMLERVDDVPRLSRLLAELQAEIGATPAPDGIPTLVDHLSDNVARAPLLSSTEREIVYTELLRRTGGTALCHFDVHPNNVLMAGKQPMIIDWFDAAAGSPEADIVRSSVLMRQDAAIGHLPCTDPSLIDYVHSCYIATVASIRDIDTDALLEWESPILAGRLAEPIHEAMRQTTYRAWRDLQASQPTRLTTSLESIGNHPRGSTTQPR
ncbi:MAG: aminoglycoside phosphotransferase family protein [Acidimicrobiia bacterium]|jgi:hypothetical protein